MGTAGRSAKGPELDELDDDTVWPVRGEFTPRGWGLFERAAAEAATTGGEVGPGHLLLALLSEEGGPLVSSLAEGPGPSPGLIRAGVFATIARSRPAKDGGEPRLSGEVAEILQVAAGLASGTGAGGIDSAHLSLALLDNLPPKLDAALRLPPLRLSLSRIRSQLARLIAALNAPGGIDNTPAFPWLPSSLPSEDLTAAATEGYLSPAIPPRPAAGSPDAFERIARVLYRKSGGHVLITGLGGVGKTTTIRELARRAEAGIIPFLKDKRFLWIDSRNISPEESTAYLTAIFNRVDGESNVVLCLDGLGPLLRKPGGASNARVLRALIDDSNVRVVGALSRWEYIDLVSGDPEALEPFTRVDIEEPTEEVAETIAIHAATELARDYRLKIAPEVARKAVALSATFMLGERLPAKAIKVLRRACDDRDYERTQLGRTCREVDDADVVRVVGDLTGLPEETLAGGPGDEDLEAALAAVVVGQEEAVRLVADELALIKAGLSEPGKPASVLLFAGMTGVGKTELAKRLAELYSSSKRLQTYAMGNYLEPHTVSGIIGVPPGYVGHEAGGRLVNELNADPHAVFLLDEAEKCHPNIWKPFLNLFDEGWIADARGVKAHADRAIFILTTNAGDDAIAQMSKSGKPAEEIEAYVKETLARVRQERSGQPVFPPQFLARIRRVVVFRPLGEAAMVGVARKVAGRVTSLWLRRRGRVLDLPESLVDRIGRLAYHLNEAAGGKEGGRIVRKLVSDLIEGPVQREATRRHDDYRRARTIIVREVPADRGTGIDSDSDAPLNNRPVVAVDFLPAPECTASGPGAIIRCKPD